MSFPLLRSVLPLAVVSLIILALCLLPSASFSAPPTATGVVTGRVVEIVEVAEASDVKKKEKPIADVTVTLWLKSDRSGTSPLVSSVTKITNKQGMFRAELPPGDWGVEWQALHHYSENEDKNPAFGPPPAPTVTITAVGKAKVLTLVMRRKAVLFGCVKDAAGHPFDSKEVWIIGPDSQEPGPPAPYRIQLDRNGFYEIVFPYGGHKEASGKVTSIEQDLAVVVPGDDLFAPFATFTLNDGKRTRLDFSLRRGATVAGHVYAADGATPVAGAQVFVHADVPQDDKGKNYRASYLLPSYIFRCRAVSPEDKEGGLGGSPRGYRAGTGNARFVVDYRYAGSAITDKQGAFTIDVNALVTYKVCARVFEQNAKEGTFVIVASTLANAEPRIQLRSGQSRKGVQLILQPAKIEGVK